jgi:hypothetical protein
MNLIYGVKQVMHRIRVKLYPNYLPGQENTFIARTDSEATLNIDQVCAALRDRGGFTGNIDDLADYVKQFLNETAYQLCDGFTVNTGYFSIYPNIGGTFKTEHELPDAKAHPLTFRFRPHKALRKLAESISVINEGLAETDGYIDEYLDAEEQAINSIFVPGNQFILHGNKIKIAGDSPDVGLYFVPVDAPDKAVKVTRIAENSPSKIIGIAPQTGYNANRIEVRTQWAGSSTKFLANLRVVTGKFTIEEA